MRSEAVPRRATLLALSGGGILARFTTGVLDGLEALRREVRGPGDASLGGAFDLIAGTSAGALVAAGLAVGRSAEDLSQAFERHGAMIFPAKGKFAKAFHLLTPFHRQEPLARAIDEVMDGRPIRLGDLAEAGRHLAIPALNESLGRPVVFTTLDPAWADLSLKDAILASSAAPLYLPAHRIGQDRYIDGGLFANAPDLVAVNLIRKRWPHLVLSDLTLVSVGTTMGVAASPRPSKDPGRWGTLRWAIWPPMRLVLATLRAQTDHTMDVLPQLGLASLHRLDAHLDPERELDDASTASLEALRNAARRCLDDLSAETYEELRLVVARQHWR